MKEEATMVPERQQREGGTIPDDSAVPPTVLIVEDEQPLADLYAAWLTKLYLVRTAYDGDQALEQLDDDVSVVLLDRRMPHVSGDEVLEKIREHDYDCRVAMVSGVDPDFDIIDMGFDDYLTKPVSEADLHDMVEQLLARINYDQQLQEYFALVSKISALEAEKSQTKLGANQDYVALKEQAAEDRDRLNALLADVEEDDIRTLL